MFTPPANQNFKATKEEKDYARKYGWFGRLRNYCKEDEILFEKLYIYPFENIIYLLNRQAEQDHIKELEFTKAENKRKLESAKTKNK